MNRPKYYTKVPRFNQMKPMSEQMLIVGGVSQFRDNNSFNSMFGSPPQSQHMITHQKPLQSEFTQSQVYPRPMNQRAPARCFKITPSFCDTRQKKPSKSETSSPERKYRSPLQKESLTIQHDDTIKLNRINTDLSDEDTNSHLVIDKFDDAQSDHSFEESVYGRPMILESQFPNRPPTLFFQYPPICEQIRSAHRARQMTISEEEKYQPIYRVLGQVPYKCVTSAFESAGFIKYKEDEDDDDIWNVMWGIGNKRTMKTMNKYQKINHFPGCWNMGRKDNLWMNLSKMKRKFPREYDFVPNTYLLAYDYDRFIAQKEQAPKGMLWIMKPCAAARGRGIRMISKKSKVTKKKNYLVMDYISRPHLVNNFKYDLRVYVLISGFDPLRVYIYNEGLVRFATEAYSLSQKDLSKKYVHLTNFSVNKKSPTFVKNQQTDQDGQGSKWSHSALRRKYREMGIDSNKLFDRISDVILKTCIASEPFMLDSNAKSPEHKNSFFELYGFDILIDQDLKPWVLEVNVCPSLNSSSPLDKKIKTALISDILHLVGVPLWDKSRKRNTCRNINLHEIASIISPVHRQASIFSKNINDISSISSGNCTSRLTQEVRNCYIQQDWNSIYTVLEEQTRCGGFKCVYPVQESVTFYQQFFEYPRYNNKIIEKFFSDSQKWLSKQT